MKFPQLDHPNATDSVCVLLPSILYRIYYYNSLLVIFKCNLEEIDGLNVFVMSHENWTAEDKVGWSLLLDFVHKTDGVLIVMIFKKKHNKNGMTVIFWWNGFLQWSDLMLHVLLAYYLALTNTPEMQLSRTPVLPPQKRPIKFLVCLLKNI